MIRQAWVVLRKELLEQFGDRSSRRGSLIQAAVIIGVVGILTPAQSPDSWLRQDPAALLLFLLVPSMLAVVVAADSFAGERERRTLETLLATPLSDAEILLGKAGAAMSFGLVATLVALALAVITVNASAHPPSLFIPGWTFVAALFGGALSSMVLTTALAIILSSQFAVARSAQQVSSLLSLAIWGGGAFIWAKLGVALDWPNLFRAEGLLLLLGAGVMSVAVRSFRRDTLFDQR